MKRRIPHRNRSPHGWWLASYIERFVWDDKPETLETRCRASENTILVKARDRDAAYEKAMAFAMLAHGNPFDDGGDRRGRVVVEGLTSLLPIYEKLRDGAEIMWVDHRRATVRTVRRKVRQKHELGVFDDTPGPGDPR
jgi:hypothetical protein